MELFKALSAGAEVEAGGGEVHPVGKEHVHRGRAADERREVAHGTVESIHV